MKKDYSYDRIGDRLSGRNLTKHERVLALDDAVRVRWMGGGVLSDPFSTIVDIGASDGTISDLWYYRNPMATFYLIEQHTRHVTSLAAKTSAAWCFFGDASAGLIRLGLKRADVVLLGEVLEHMTPRAGADLLRNLPPTAFIFITVPNRNSQSYDKAKRSRWDWPDHKRHFTARSFRNMLTKAGLKIQTLQPIVGTLNDSIWLGAVCQKLR